MTTLNATLSIFASILGKGLDNSIVLPFDTEVVAELGEKIADKKLSFANTFEELHEISGGGTYMEMPIKYLLENHVVVDYLITITDSEEWGLGFLRYWKQYKKKVNPRAAGILIRVDPYGTRPFDEEFAEEMDIYEVYGWNPNSVIKWVEHVALSRTYNKYYSRSVNRKKVEDFER